MKKYFHENLYLSFVPYTDNIKSFCYINITDYPILHSHEDYWEFTVMQSGTIVNLINGHKDIVQPNMLFFGTPRDKHLIRKTADTQPLRYINITVRSSVVEDLLKCFSPALVEKLYKGKRCFSLPMNIVHETEAAIHSYNLLTPQDYVRGDDILIATIMQLLNHVVFKSLGQANAETDFCERLSALMSNTDSLTYTVADLCQKLNYSRTQLNRIFKKELDTTPHNYLIDNKFVCAQRLLVQSDMKIVMIAQEIGYANLSQFNIIFKEKFGITPSQYRKQIGKKTVEPKE